MIGAIAGDRIGSPDERYPMKNPDFIIWVAGVTDDPVLTVAVAAAMLTGTDYAGSIKTVAPRHPHDGDGGAFRKWTPDLRAVVDGFIDAYGCTY